MAVIRRVLWRYTSADMQFFGLLAITWLCFYSLINCTSGGRFGTDFALALGASIVSFLTLRVLGYFNPLRIMPRRSDVLLPLVAVPSGGLFLHLSFEILLGTSVCELRTILAWTPVLALVIFGTHYSLSLSWVKSGKKKKVVLDLLPTEKSALIEVLGELGLEPHLEYLTLLDLKRHFLKRRANEISLIIISRAAVAKFDAEAILVRAHLTGIPIVDFKKAMSELTGRIPLGDSDLWTYVMGATRQTVVLRTLNLVKEVVEPWVALALGIILAPIMLAVAMAIKLSDSGPIFYRQVRTGYLGRPFTLIKFRSMRVDSERDGPRWAAENDQRLTAVGRFIRRTRLDELPQLWNVFTGEMSFFGPRPERPEIYANLSADIPLFSMRLIVRPGITGWAQVCAGYAASVAESKLKLEYDLFYIQHMSPRLDLIILLRTLMVAIVGDGYERRRKVAVAAAQG